MNAGKFGYVGLTVAAAAAAGTLAATGVGNATPTTSGTATSDTTSTGGSITTPPPPTATPNRIYLRIMGVPGDVQDVGFADSIAASAFSWSLTGASSGSSSGGSGSGRRAMFSDLVVSANFDRALPPLKTDSATGRRLPSVVVTQTGARGQVVRTIALTNAAVDSIKINGAAATGATADYSFSFQKETTTYYYQTPSGSTVPYASSFDVSRNVAG